MLSSERGSGSAIRAGPVIYIGLQLPGDGPEAQSQRTYNCGREGQYTRRTRCEVEMNVSSELDVPRSFSEPANRPQA